jgi:hypothetical protein|tara:strand:+ start:244 stop:501 length:258 start_codon:yes stop_codon:yes gene_type:complete
LSNPLPIGVDGYGRPVQTDREISANVAQVFESATGKEVLRYLRSITIEMVNGPNVTNEELRHMEGQRYLVGLIERRIQSAHRKKA